MENHIRFGGRLLNDRAHLLGLFWRGIGRGSDFRSQGVEILLATRRHGGHLLLFGTQNGTVSQLLRVLLSRWKMGRVNLSENLLNEVEEYFVSFPSRSDNLQSALIPS